MRAPRAFWCLGLWCLAAATPAGAADYRYTIQLGEPGTVLRTDRQTGATTTCRTTPKGVWCPPSAAECRALLEQVDASQSERTMPSEREVIDCLQHDRCDVHPRPPKAPPAQPAIDEAALTWCLEH